jgi:mRNA interferase YafQ
MQTQGKDIDKLHDIMEKLINEENLPERHREHTLIGNFKDRRECHIEPDWLLIYKLDKKKETIIFERTGSHAHLFE